MKKIALATPIGVETGGPEALYQMCHIMRGFGADAYILPWEGTENNKPVASYSKYNAPIDTSFSQETFLVVPETVPELILKSRRSAIWWLSVDNSPLLQNNSSNHVLQANEQETNDNHTEFWKRFHSSSVLHYTQSYYAKSFIKRTFDIDGQMLTDFISDDVFNIYSRAEKDLVTFSLKGSDNFHFYQKMLGEYNCIQIRDMSKEKAMEALVRSRLYIDLGNQPGRDRLPREASLLKSHVMLNKDGAASYFWDAPLSNSFKFNINDSYRAIEKIKSYLEVKPAPKVTQLFYRNWVKSQYSTFKFEVWRFLKSI